MPIDLGLRIANDGRLSLDFADTTKIGGMYDVPDDGAPYVRHHSYWERVVAPDQITYAIGLENEIDPLVVNLKVAGGGATTDEIGGVRALPRSLTQGLEIDTQGFISAPLATHQHAGSIVDTLPDDKTYVRKTNTQGASSWVEANASVDVGIGLEFNATDPNVIDLQPATATEIGGLTEPRPWSSKYNLYKISSERMGSITIDSIAN